MLPCSSSGGRFKFSRVVTTLRRLNAFGICRFRRDGRSCHRRTGRQWPTLVRGGQLRLLRPSYRSEPPIVHSAQGGNDPSRSAHIASATLCVNITLGLTNRREVSAGTVGKIDMGGNQKERLRGLIFKYFRNFGGMKSAPHIPFLVSTDIDCVRRLPASKLGVM